jgi:hypothetical protein
VQVVVDGVTLPRTVGIDQLVVVEEVEDMSHQRNQTVLMVLVGEQEIVTTTLAPM